MRRLSALAALASLAATLAGAGEFPRFESREIDPRVGNVCYAVATADVDGDGKPDVVAVAEDAVYWYQNPTWAKHTIIRDKTERDNVCIQPRDIDGDGRVDFALGASWQPTNTKTGGTLQVLTRTGAKADGEWRIVPIASEPTLHRVRWGDVLGTGTPQLVVAPLQGRDTKGPDWGAGRGTRILVFSVPEKPFDQPWTSVVAEEGLHTTHNLQITDFDDDGKAEIVVAAWEGVFVLKHEGKGQWHNRQIGSGLPRTYPSLRQGRGETAAKPARTTAWGASEVKVGRLKDGSKYMATIEPWHGYQVVVYRPGARGEPWNRTVIDEPLEWGHAVWCADLDGDGDDEVVLGQRDPSKDPARSPKGPGLFVYDPKPGPSGLSFDRHVIDDGGVAVEDALAADLDGDGRPDLIAGGRATHNLKLYWNRSAR